ncbi:MAG: tRNA adenosine(34) deaminase TadA [Deltaproteobacteria bacterium]|nr:tRNA adenosine(34) deaminase TadA [Deltaproteobacteria bacterium]
MTDLDHDHFMSLALEEGQLAGLAGDVPVGAVVVLEGEVIGLGRNRRQAEGDPTAHAEIEALRRAARALGNWRVEADLYVTQEPCPMCAGAIVNARVRRLFYGCDSPKSGAVKTLFQLVTDPRLNHRVEVTSGVMATECGRLLTEFFQALRDRK